MTQSIGLRLNLEENDIEVLISYAVSVGYKRDNPEKAWTVHEKRHFARLAIRDMIASCIVRAP